MSIVSRIKGFFIKEVVVEKLKYIGTVINCDRKECIENERGKCSISDLSLEMDSDLRGIPLFSCSEYCKHDAELIKDVNKMIISGN